MRRPSRSILPSKMGLASTRYAGWLCDQARADHRSQAGASVRSASIPSSRTTLTRVYALDRNGRCVSANQACEP